MEIRARAVLCAYPAAHRFCRRVALSPAQRCAQARQTKTTADGGTLRATRRGTLWRNSASAGESEADDFRCTARCDPAQVQLGAGSTRRGILPRRRVRPCQALAGSLLCGHRTTLAATWLCGLA